MTRTQDVPPVPPGDVPAVGVEASLTDRVPAQAAMTALHARQQHLRPRGRLRRALGCCPLSEQTSSWYWDAVGELAVGRVLAQLGPGWHVLHAVPVGDGETAIDHVVVGPGGVFTLRVENHAGHDVRVAGPTLTAQGRQQSHLQDAALEARVAGDRLTGALGRPVAVTPVVVVVDENRLAGTRRGGTSVVSSARLARWLLRRPAVLAPDEAAQLWQVAGRPGTWHDRCPAGPPAPCAWFASLDHAVRQARLLRAVWPVLAAGALGVVATAAGHDGLSAAAALLGP